MNMGTWHVTWALLTWGPAAVITVFLATALGILFLPAALIQQPEPVPWWKNVRFWAVAICLVQMAVYWIWG